MPRITLNFASRMARSVKQHCAGYGALSAGLYAIFKVIFTNNKTFLLNNNRRAQVCRTLLMHWFVYFISKRSSSRRTRTVASFFQLSEPQLCMGDNRSSISNILFETRVAPDLIFSNPAGARFGRIWDCRSGRGQG